MQKVSPTIGIIIIIVVAFVLFGGVFAYQYYLNSKLQITNSQTADWKTYTNNEYGFGFAYPGGVSIQEHGNMISVDDNRQGYNFEWDMKLYKNSSKEDLNEWINSQFNSFSRESDKDCKIVPSDKYGSKVVIKDAYTLLVDAPSFGASCGHVAYYTISPDKLIIMEFDLVQASPELYQDLLSTFKFTK